MAVDPLLVGLLAAARILPLVALVAWVRGATGMALGGLAALGWALTAGQAMRGRAVGDGIRRRAANDAAAAIARRAPSTLGGASHDAILVRIWRGFFARSQLATEVDPTIVAMSIALPFAFVLAAMASGWMVPSVAVVAGGLAIAVRIPLSRWHRGLLEPVDAAVTRLARDLGTGMRALDDLHAHGLENAFADRIARDAELLQREEGRLSVAAAIATWTPVLVSALAVLAWLAPDLSGNKNSVLFRAATLLAFAPIGLALMRAMVTGARCRRDARALDELVAMPPDLAPAGDEPPPKTLAPFALDRVRYRPTTPFGANSAVKDVFTSLSFRWNGERPLALVGPNGSGKTSLIALLLRLADPADGTVSVGGIDLKRLSPGAFRARIAYVPQRPLVLEGMNVGEAMRLVAPDAKSEELLAALEEVDLLDRLRARGDPLSVPCASLSVGEAQRVAVARALARAAELLVLDEPEAGLDAEARGRVKAALEARIAKGARVVMAAQHRDVVPEGATVMELPLAESERIDAD
ncbi:MAG: ATP-binding cassette domain-containing protein [Polyangiales bacterium]